MVDAKTEVFSGEKQIQKGGRGESTLADPP